MIYVDQIHYSSKQVSTSGRRDGKMWSRLFADTSAELHVVAAQLHIDMSQQYDELRHPNRKEPIGYYKLSAAQRKEAVERGAVEIQTKLAGWPHNPPES